MLDLVSQYFESKLNKRIIEHATIFRHEGNSVCGDDITVYLLIDTVDNTLSTDSIDNQIIKDRSYDGNTSMITTAASSFFSELIVGKTLWEVLQMTYENTLLLHGFEVTPRRKRAWAIAILATRNAIHEFLQDGQVDTWDEVVAM